MKIVRYKGLFAQVIHKFATGEIIVEIPVPYRHSYRLMLCPGEYQEVL